jgi:hypothetical protein
LPDRYEVVPTRSQGLVDVLDRILDKGLVIAGDINIRLADVELLTIRIRLLICSVDKAEEIGMTWWRDDARLGAGERDGPQLAALHDKLDRLAERLTELEKKRLTD